MVKKTEPVKTVLTIVLGFVVVFAATRADAWLIAALVTGVAGLASARLARFIDTWWMKLAQLLGLIVPNILLGAIFFLFLFPIALLARLFSHKDPLNLTNRLQSNYVDSRKSFSKESFEKYW